MFASKDIIAVLYSTSFILLFWQNQYLTAELQSLIDISNTVYNQEQYTIKVLITNPIKVIKR
jgi:hypothetical protein